MSEHGIIGMNQSTNEVNSIAGFDMMSNLNRTGDNIGGSVLSKVTMQKRKILNQLHQLKEKIKEAQGWEVDAPAGVGPSTAPCTSYYPPNAVLEEYVLNHLSQCHNLKE